MSDIEKINDRKLEDIADYLMDPDLDFNDTVGIVSELDIDDWVKVQRYLEQYIIRTNRVIAMRKNIMVRCEQLIRIREIKEVTERKEWLNNEGEGYVKEALEVIYNQGGGE